jgi:hypothetical protein
MLPRNVMNDTMNTAMPQSTELPPQRRKGYISRCVKSSHFTYLLLGQFCAWRLFAAPYSSEMRLAFPTPTPSNHIGAVIAICSYQQMRRIAAGRVVARMAHYLAFRYYALCCFVDHTMSTTMSPVDINLTIAPIARNTTSPRPTFVRFTNVDVTPQASRPRLALQSVFALIGAAVRLIGPKLRRGAIKQLVAEVAGTVWLNHDVNATTLSRKSQELYAVA